MNEAFGWAMKNGGLCYESDYPYTSGKTKTTGPCQLNCSKDSKVVPSSYSDVQKNSDWAMMSAVVQQPVSVAIEANEDFMHYQSGVFTSQCGTDLNHAVLIVGYGNSNGADFYKAKNSWGERWGMQGYILLQRGGTQKEGQCGLLQYASYPTL